MSNDLIIISVYLNDVYGWVFNPYSAKCLKRNNTLSIFSAVLCHFRDIKVREFEVGQPTV